MPVELTAHQEEVHNNAAELIVDKMETADSIVAGLKEVDGYIAHLEGISPATQTNLKVLALMATHLYLTGNPNEIIQRAHQKQVARAKDKFSKGEITQHELEIVLQPALEVNEDDPNFKVPNEKGKKILQGYLLRNLQKYLHFYPESEAAGEPLYPTIGHELEVDSKLTEQELLEAYLYSDIGQLVTKLGIINALAIDTHTLPFKAIKDEGNTLEYIFDPTISPKTQMRISFLIQALFNINYENGAVFHETIGGIKLGQEHHQALILKPMWSALGYEPGIEQKLDQGPSYENRIKYSKLDERGHYVYIPFHRARSTETYKKTGFEESKEMVEMRSNPRLKGPESILAQARKVDFDFCAATCIQAAQGLSKLPPEKAKKLAKEWEKLEQEFEELNLQHGVRDFPGWAEITSPILSFEGISKFLQQTTDREHQNYIKSLLKVVIETGEAKFPREIVEMAERLDKIILGIVQKRMDQFTEEDLHIPTVEGGQPILEPESYFTQAFLIGTNRAYSGYIKQCEVLTTTNREYRSSWRRTVIAFKKRVKDIIHDRDQQN